MQYRVSGPDLCAGAVDRAAASPRCWVATPSSEISYDWMEPARQVRVTIDQDQARLLGLSSQRHRRSDQHPDGRNRRSRRCVTTSISYRRHRAGARRTAQLAVDAARPANSAAERPHACRSSQVATFDFEQEYPLIWRRQRVPDPDGAGRRPGRRVSPAAAVDALAPAIAKLRASLPQGLPHRRRAARSRRAPIRRPRSSPRCP